MPGQSDGFFPDDRFSQPDTAFSGGALKSWLHTHEAQSEIEHLHSKQQPSVKWEPSPAGGWRLTIVRRDGSTKLYEGPTDELLKLARMAS